MSKLLYKIKIDWNQNVDLSSAHAMWLYQRANTAAGLAIVEDVNRRFQNEGAPPQKWKPLKPATIRNRIQGNKKSNLPTARILQDKSNLAKSIQMGQLGNVFKANAKSVTVGTRIIYAAVHQFGYKKKNIPQRQFIYSPNDIPALQEDVNDIYMSILKAYIQGNNP